MHAYSTDSADRRWAPLVLAGASIALTYVCSRLLAAFNLAWPWWIENPSILLFYGAFWSLYDRILWRQQLLRIRLSQLPDLGGTWRVRLQSCHDGGTGGERARCRQGPATAISECAEVVASKECGRTNSKRRRRTAESTDFRSTRATRG